MSADAAFTRIARPAAEVFAFLSDPTQMDRWSLGTWRVEVRDGLVHGVSAFGGGVNVVRIDPCPDRLLIDYHIGPDPQTLTPWIFARITPEHVFGDDQGAGLALIALRRSGMDDGRWGGLQHTHRVEVGLVKSALETGHDHRAP